MATTDLKSNAQVRRKRLFASFARQKTRAVVNPFHNTKEKKITVAKPTIFVFDFGETKLEQYKPKKIEDCFQFHATPTTTWINMDGLEPVEMEAICNHFGIHNLIQEDIATHGQRPKMDTIEDVLFVVLNMLFYNETYNTIEQEQISIVLVKNVVLSFQEDAERDVFDPVRKRLQVETSKERTRGADYLFYSLLDVIADSYIDVIEKIGSQIELLEETILTKSTAGSFERISQLRKDIILLKRNAAPVKDLISSLVRSDSQLLLDNTRKYFKDVNDHIMQANDLIDNYRDLLMGLQDLYVNNINLRMNEVMKTLAIMTAVMAPATVIGAVFGMNFEIIPYSHQQWGFYATVTWMVIIPIAMIWWFRKRGWFEKDYPANDN